LPGFMILVDAVIKDKKFDGVSLLEIELPLEIKCSTCRFLTAEFVENSPCWECMIEEDLPKWRPKA